MDPAAAVAAFTDVHRKLADAAVAVDKFYRRHSDELEKARSLRDATPKISADAKAAALAAETQLTKAEQDGFAYPSVMHAAGELVEALSALKTAETVGSPMEIRHAAAAVHSAAEAVTARISTARSLLSTVRGSVSSVKTRIEGVSTRLESLPATRSALLREFSADCSKDLNGADDRARRSLERARTAWAAARKALDSGQPEEAANQLTAARASLSAAEDDGDAMGDRLRVLRETKADPTAAAKATRFKLRDAQLLVVDRGLVRQWGSVLDAQAARIDRCRRRSDGPSPRLLVLSADPAFRGCVRQERHRPRPGRGQITASTLPARTCPRTVGDQYGHGKGRHVRHFDHLTKRVRDDLFAVSPAEFDLGSSRTVLATALGATLYVPGVREDLAARSVAARRKASGRWWSTSRTPSPISTSIWR